MLLHMTYGFLFWFAFVRTISYHNWFVYLELYYLQLYTIIAYHLNANIMLLYYVICNYIWHMGSQNYELFTVLLLKHIVQFKVISRLKLNANIALSKNLRLKCNSTMANRVENYLEVLQTYFNLAFTIDMGNWFGFFSHHNNVIKIGHLSLYPLHSGESASFINDSRQQR